MTLASELGNADRALRSAEVKVEALLTALFTDWKGWQFHRDDQSNRFAIDVYEATLHPIALRALFSAGFTTVCVHPHKADKFLTCTCRARDAY